MKILILFAPKEFIAVTLSSEIQEVIYDVYHLAGWNTEMCQQRRLRISAVLTLRIAQEEASSHRQVAEFIVVVGAV